MEKKQSNKKEDPLSPTPIESSKGTGKARSQYNRISDEELNDKLETYSKITSSEKHDFVFEELKRKYQADAKALNDNHTKAAVNYAHGLRSGLPQSHYDEIRDAQERTQQNLRSNTANEAKEIYDSKNNLRTGFTNHKQEEVNDIFDRHSPPKLKRKIGKKSAFHKSFKKEASQDLQHKFLHESKDKDRLRHSFDNGRAIHEKLQKKHTKEKGSAHPIKKSKDKGMKR